MLAQVDAPSLGGDVTTALAPNSAPLTAADRCDRCGAQAYVRVRLSSGGELLFCNHHATAYRERLQSEGAVLQDETARLEERAATTER